VIEKPPWVIKLNGAAPRINRPISRELSKRRHHTHAHEHQHSTKDDKNSGLLQPAAFPVHEQGEANRQHDTKRDTNRYLKPSHSAPPVPSGYRLAVDMTFDRVGDPSGSPGLLIARTAPGVPVRRSDVSRKHYVSPTDAEFASVTDSVKQ